MFYDKFERICMENGISKTKVLLDLNISKSNNTAWKNGRNNPSNEMIRKISDYFGVSPDYFSDNADRLADFAPSVTDDYVTFPVIGEVAAGYEHIAIEDWSGDTIDIPASFLHGRAKSDFFVLKVTGDSMYPTYQDGDKVLVLKQTTLNHSGQVGVILYDGELGTLKRVEYVTGEDWMKLVPINPAYPPKKITGADLEQCRVIGIPKVLIRCIED